MPDTIDINISPVIETVALTIQPNLTTINVNTITGGGGAVTSVNTLVGDVVLTQDTVLDGSTFKQYSLTEKNKLAGIAAGAEVNVNADWNAVSGDAQILNKPAIPDVSTLVPYTGATADVNLGEFGLLTGNLEFDNTPTNLPTAAGSMYYNDTDGTLDLKLKGGNVTLQIGQEQVVRVVNKTATNITLLEANYQAVRVTGAQGQRLKVDLALATTDALSAETIGLVTETIANNQEGFVTTSGLVRGINTTGSLQSETWADGDVLYLSPTTAGNVTKVKPTGANHLVVIGYVIYAHVTQGTIFVKVINGYEISELHDVDITSVADKQLLSYDSATSLWKNKSVTTADIASSTNKNYVTDAQATVIGNTSGTNTGDNSVNTNSNSYADAKVSDTITDGVTTIAPSQNAVFDALALKQNALTYTPYRFTAPSQIVHTGVLTETILQTILIPANTFSNGDFIMFSALVSKLANIGNTTHNLKINTTNTLVGASTIALIGFNTVNFFMKFKREFVVNGGNIYGYTTALGTPNDQSTTNTTQVVNTATYNLSADLYLFVTCTLTNSLDTITYRGINFYKQ